MAEWVTDVPGSVADVPGSVAATTVGSRRLLPIALAAGAIGWAVLLNAPASFDHDALEPYAGALVAWSAAPAVLLGWLVMVVAMMVPPSLPMLDLLRTLVARRQHRGALLAVGVTAFLSVWLVAGVALVTGDLGLHALAERTGWLARHPGLVAGAVLISAGAYQLSPLKEACLRACRSPRGFAVAHWRGRRPAVVEMATLTGAYAGSCVGCCWALMAVSFALGAAALPVMIVLGLLMSAERLTTWGRRLVRPSGAVLAAVGVAVLLDLSPAVALAF